ncbi:MAG TPA: winged helix-turn-helix domain-containing protein [Puia sp.]|nr:winged helix-turn-helix domain-containing protein [Puia sp.]
MVINDRFVVDPLRHEVTDKQMGKVNRVEPRLIKLLCLLAEYEGKTVSRKIIVKEIWDDYPGGDEGLNQAISVLRKLLDDDKKAIIETIPKTGYCFHGEIGRNQIAPERKSFRKIYVLAAMIPLLIGAFALGYYNHPANDRIVPRRLSHEESVKAFKMDSKTNLDTTEKTKPNSRENEQPRGTDDRKSR